MLPLYRSGYGRFGKRLHGVVGEKSGVRGGAMIRMRFLDAADVVGGDAQGTDVGFRGVNLDSRRARPGQLFVAMSGMQHDGADKLTATDR